MTVCWLQKTFSFPAYLKCFDAQAASNYINPYSVDVIRAERRDLIYGVSHTENLLDHLVAEGAMTAAKRYIVLTRIDQNCRVLDKVEARGERACRKFFHPCLMLAKPDLYQQIKAYMLVVWTNILETQGDNWLDIPWRGTRRGIDKITARIVTREIHTLFSTEETKKSSSVKEDRSTVPFLKSGEPAQSKADHVGSSTWLLKMGRSCCWRSSWSIKEPNWTCRIIGVTQLFIEQLAGATLW